MCSRSAAALPVAMPQPQRGPDSGNKSCGIFCFAIGRVNAVFGCATKTKAKTNTKNSKNSKYSAIFSRYLARGESGVLQFSMQGKARQLAIGNGPLLIVVRVVFVFVFVFAFAFTQQYVVNLCHAMFASLALNDSRHATVELLFSLFQHFYFKNSMLQPSEVAASNWS